MLNLKSAKTHAIGFLADKPTVTHHCSVSRVEKSATRETST